MAKRRRKDELAKEDIENIDGNLRSRTAQDPQEAARPEVDREHVHAEMAGEAEKVNAAWLEEQEQEPSRDMGQNPSAPSEPRGDKAHDEFHDSELPPPPQERRARATADRSKRVKDKNTGIKGRDASGKKHARSR
ncbi:MAG TPA: hypothetical protein VEJ63_01190 [Planctomycetota bacterium]|nr:hypothetical protein [Planctomycetota bacterium]